MVAGTWFLCANQGAIGHQMQQITFLGQGLKLGTHHLYERFLINYYENN